MILDHPAMSAFKHSAVSFGTSDTPPPEAGRNIGPISLHNAIKRFAEVLTLCESRIRLSAVSYQPFVLADGRKPTADGLQRGSTPSQTALKGRPWKARGQA